MKDSYAVPVVDAFAEPVTFERTRTTITQVFTISTTGGHDAALDSLTRRNWSPADMGANLEKTSVRTVSIKSTTIRNK